MAAWVEASTRDRSPSAALISQSKSSLSASLLSGDAGKPALGPKPHLMPKPFALQRTATIRPIKAPKISSARQLQRAASSDALDSLVSSKSELVETRVQNTSESVKPNGTLNVSDRSASPKPAPLGPKPALTPKTDPGQNADITQTAPNKKPEDGKNVQSRARAKSMGSQEQKALRQTAEGESRCGDADVRASSPCWPVRNRLSVGLTSRFESPEREVGSVRRDEPPLSPSASKPQEDEEISGTSIKRRISLLFDRSAASQHRDAFSKKDSASAEISVDIKQRIKNLSLNTQEPRVRLPSTGTLKCLPHEKTPSDSAQSSPLQNGQAKTTTSEKNVLRKNSTLSSADEEEEEDDDDDDAAAEEDKENSVSVPVYRRVGMAKDPERKTQEEEKQLRDGQLKKEREREKHLVEEKTLREEMERRQEEERLKEERKQEVLKQRQREEQRKQEVERQKMIEEERKLGEERERRREQERLEREKQIDEQKRRMEEKREKERQREEQRLREEREKQEMIKKEREMEEKRRIEEEQRLRQEREKEARLKKEREMEEKRLLEEERLRQEREKQERLKKEREMEEKRRIEEEEQLRREREKQERLKKEREMEEKRRIEEEERLRREREKEARLKKEREMEEKRLLEEQRLRQERERQERLKKEREMEEKRRIEEEEQLRREREKQESLKKEREMEEKRRIEEEEQLRREREKQESLKKEREMEEKRRIEEEEQLRREREKQERIKKEREIEEEERLRQKREMERIRKEREMEERRRLQEQRLRQEREKEARLKKEREMEEKRLLEEERLRQEREKQERLKKEREMEEKRRIEEEERLRQEREMEERRRTEEQRLRQEREKERQRKEREMEEKRLIEEREEKLKKEREMEERRRVEDEKRWRQEREKERLRMERDVAVSYDFISFDGAETQREVSPQLPDVLYDDFSVKPRRWGTGTSRSSTPSPSGEAQSDDAVHDWMESRSNDPESPGLQKHQNSPGEDQDTCHQAQTETDSQTHRSTPDHITSQQGELKNCAGDDEDDEDEDERHTETRITHESNNTDVDGGADNKINQLLQRLTSQEKQRKPSIESDAPEITEPEPLLFPKSSVPLLDSSVFRSKADLGKKRSIKRSRPTRAVRQRAVLPALTEGSNPDWFCDSTDTTKAQNSESEEEPSKYATPPPAPSRPKRVPVFPGMDQSALMAQLKRRSGLMETDVTEGRTAPAGSARSPRTPTLGPRVLPPVNSRDTSSGSSPSWLRELKSKKRLSRPESDA